MRSGSSTARHPLATPRARALWLLVLVLGCAAAPPAHSAPGRPAFDHLTTGFELLGQHRDLPCESCHANAIFKGTPTKCSACHGVGSTVRATAKTATHMLSTDQCDACHTVDAWKPAVSFDHTQALGSCSSCHNNVTAQGKPPNHIVTDLECDACHTTISWAGATFTHQGVTSGCAQCHNNVSAKGMPANHMPIGTPATPCEACHLNTDFTDWLGARINHPAVKAMMCAGCHETANFLGMHPSTNTTAADSRPNATLDKNHPPTGDCGQCHDTVSFSASASLKPANHIPTSAPCAQCHATPGNNKIYSVTGVHQGVSACLSCHGPSITPTTFDIAIIGWPGNNHIPIGTLDCSGSGCHTTANVNPGGFRLGSASVSSPTLNVAGHTTVAAVTGCSTCHETAPYLGMIASTASAWGDSRPTAYDPRHPTAAQAPNCGSCHSTTPTFGNNQLSGALPAGHIPIAPPTYASQPQCPTCHTTAGNFALYSVGGVHQGVTGCLACHGSTLATSYLNVSMVTTPANHIPIGTLDCNGSGCHTTGNVNSGGFKLGSANILSPTLSVVGHTTVASVSNCAGCHETASFAGMVASTNTTPGDSRPNATLDSLHPTAAQAPDCVGCHTTTPTFGGDLTAASKPAGHIPTSAPCAQCHTTPGNYALYSATGVHQGVTGCLACHGPGVGPFKNVAIVTMAAAPGTHIPIGTLDCNASGCHTTGNVTPGGGGFKLGTANISSPTLNVAGHTSLASGGVSGCVTCHDTANFAGMVPSGNSPPPGDSRPNATLDINHQTPPKNTGDCGNCHVTIPTFASNLLPTAPKPANHIPTTAVCAQCHTTAGNFAVYSVTGVHQGVTTCAQCHGSGTGPFAGPPPSNTITIVGLASNHIPIGTADCGSSGCHTSANVNPGDFKIGTASISSPTLNVAGHTTVAGAGVAGCQGCHESAPYLGMVASTNVAGDSRPGSTLDKNHPTSGDCNSCHTTTPTFASDQTGNAKPANHIPTTAPCAQCHTTPGNNSVYSVTGVHQGVTGCLTCHAPSVASTFANVTIVTSPGNHMPIGTANCNGSGCHSTANVNPGGFRIGAASVSTPTLTVAGHTTVAGAGVSGCVTCHETAPYLGMIASSASAWGDSRPSAYDKSHPATGECSGCHTTTPTFNTNQTAGAKPVNHIPTSGPCAQCHTTAGDYAAYSVTAVHTGVTGCLTCHGPTVAATFAHITIVTTPSNHIPIGSLDCNRSGCHSTANVNPGGFRIGAASITSPTLTIAGHTSIAGAGGVSGCQTCHETAAYLGMLPSTASAGEDSRPTAFDKNHPTSGDCNGCHTTTPTFSTNQSGSSAKPANHIPTTAACAQCHTTAGNYGLYTMGATGHAGITSNCAQCHAYGLSFYNMAPPTLKEPASGATGHIPAVPPNGTTAIACELCHSPTAFTTFSGTVMKHAYVTSMKCDSCHEYGMTWQTNSGTHLWTRPSPNHHAGQDCGGSGCHTSRDRFAMRAPTTLPRTTTAPVAPRAGVPAPTTAAPAAATAAFSHATVAGSACLTCHTGASGKPPGHIAVSNACQSCHTTLAWLPVTKVDHTQVIGSCSSCHNGQIATGKPSSHIATSAACASCHTTIAWTPARFDHAAIAAHTCTTCHNSVRATGLPRAHIPTTQQCDSCHGTLAWSPVKVDHSHLTVSCASCHNNVGAVGFPPGHLATQLDCARCHSYADWSAVQFRHTSVAYPGGRHATLNCTSCHTSGSAKIPYASAADVGSCAGCHAKDFKPAAHPQTLRGVSYTAHELADCTGACHVYGDSTRSTITRSQKGPHHRVTDATFRR
jgi:hypothetical protein